MKHPVLIITLMLSFSTTAFSQLQCMDLQKTFDQVRAGSSEGDTWNAVKGPFGNPSVTREANGRILSVLYRLEGCQAVFFINPQGKVYNKRFTLGASAAVAGPATNVAAGATAPAPTISPDMVAAIRNLDSSLRQLKAQITRLERTVQALRKAAGITANEAAAPAARQPRPKP